MSLSPLQKQEQIKAQIFGCYNNTPTLIKSEEKESSSHATDVKDADDKKSEFEKLTKSEVDALNDMIEKGEISDTLGSGYGAGSKPVTFNKKGSEIKAKIPEISAALETQRAEVEVKLNTLLAQIENEPTEERSRRYSKQTSYKRFAWEVCEPKSLGNGMYGERTGQMDLCNKYNSLLYIHSDLMDDIDALKILNTNMEDGKNYELSVSQLVALNFK